MLRDDHGAPRSLPAYFALAMIAALAARWSDLIDGTPALIPALIAVVFMAAVVASGKVDRRLVTVLAVLARVRQVAARRQPGMPRPRSLEPLDSASQQRVINLSEPRAPVIAG
ncbi:hypothetical protein [Gordonia shandongensis]|uniref:hypothetical protein n=1 Tax=Gordonia shandongensis TaxID=376351 RepID=UPI0004792F35|nr:hypothetical protein [Gordonia shandongensis]